MNARVAKTLATRLTLIAFTALSGCTASIVIETDSPPKASTVRTLEWPLHNFRLSRHAFHAERSDHSRECRLFKTRVAFSAWGYRWRE